MSYVNPVDFAKKMIDAGEAKVFMSTKDTLIRAYMAGAILALAAAFAVTVTVNTGNPLIGALLAAIPFVLVHPQAYGSPVPFAHYFLDALLYALLVCAFNSLWVAVAVHAAWNTFGSVQALGIPNSAAGLVAAFAAAAAASAVVLAVLPRATSSCARTPAQRGVAR